MDSFEFMMYQFYSTSSSVSADMEITIRRVKLREQPRLDFRIVYLIKYIEQGGNNNDIIKNYLI